MPTVAYLVNQYPQVSHSFIRREILALESAGVTVARFALRGWDAQLVDPLDREERERTRYLLRDGMAGLLADTLAVALRSPLAFLVALTWALRLGWRGDRAMVYHLVYLAEACRLKRCFDEVGVDHAHAHFGTNPAEVLLLVRRLGGPPYSFTVHGPEEFDRPLALKLREKIDGSAFVVAISSYGRSQLSRWVEYAQWPKIREVHCGLDAQFLDAPLTPVPEAPRLVCVGRLCEQKGQLLLMEAARNLKQRGLAFELVLAGDGEMRSEVEALITRFDLSAEVTITGWVSSARVAEELRRARAMVLPSFAEGLPVVIMEALALGRPVVSTYIAGIPELVSPGACGWLVPAGSVEELTEAMAAVLAADADSLAGLAAEGRRRVRSRHSAVTEAGKLLDCIRGTGTAIGATPS
ncbi:MAG: glycosyltransferase family 4 protein [Halieaceae bacterium]|jgi:glycosyltransferase involved in cell wall biosynthesis|nr:glycosyltransferase family 4 protein [Halieaceae bacterium]